MKVKNVNGRSVRVGSIVVPACNIDLKQENNGEWLAHFSFSARLYTRTMNRAASYSCGWSAVDELWHVDEIVEGRPPTENSYDDVELEEFLEYLLSHGRFESDHQKIFDAAFAPV